MASNLGELAHALPDRPPGVYVVRETPLVREVDCVCHLHGRSPAVERAHPHAAIAVMLGGTFHTRGSHGSALLAPGALLLKNAASTQLYRHVDDGGDRTITFEYAPAFFQQARASFGVRHDDRAFGRVAVPPSSATAAAVVLAQHALCSDDPEALDDTAYAVAAAALAAGQFVIAVRLRAAATALLATRAPVTEIALAAGFGDLSHFTTSFGRTFGASPRRFRKLHV